VAGSTPHVWAAAATSIARAVAPALRSVSHDDRTLREPPVDIGRDHAAGFSGTGPSWTLDQSASSSSARIMASAVCGPWPISDLSIVSVTIPSLPTRSQALGLKAPSPGALARPGRAGR